MYHIPAVAETKTITINKSKKITALGVSRTSLYNHTAKKGDPFSIKLVEPVVIDELIIIPQGSILEGTVTRVDLPKNYPRRDGAILLSVDQVITPDNRRYFAERNEVNAVVLSPYQRSYRQRFRERIPTQVAYYGISIPLSETIADNDRKDLSAGEVYAIATAGAIVVGYAAGFISPYPGISRQESAYIRSVNASPFGAISQIASQGHVANLNAGDGLVLRFNPNFLRKIIAEKGIPHTVK